MSSEDKVLEILVDIGNALEALGVTIKQQIREITEVEGKPATTVKEENFNILKYEVQTGGRIGSFGVATRNSNLPEHFDRALNILKQNQATISARFHGEGYTHSYWIYQDKIYRQLKK